MTGSMSYCFLRRPENTPDDDNTPESEHVPLRASSAVDDPGPHDDRQHVPLSPRSAHDDDDGLSRRTDDDHGPEDDRRHGSLSTSSAGGDQGPHNVSSSPRRAV